MIKGIHKFTLLSLSLLVAACSSGVKLADETSVEDRSMAASDKGATGSVDGRSVNSITLGNAQKEGQGAHAERSIFFDYDSYIVKPEYHATIEAHAKFLNANRQKKIMIEGHTDESGGREYNLALGQKRAEAVRRALTLLGVSSGQIESISFGEEKPRATGSDDASMAQNRRADIAY